MAPVREAQQLRPRVWAGMRQGFRGSPEGPVAGSGVSGPGLWKGLPWLTFCGPDGVAWGWSGQPGGFRRGLCWKLEAPKWAGWEAGQTWSGSLRAAAALPPLIQPGFGPCSSPTSLHPCLSEEAGALGAHMPPQCGLCPCDHATAPRVSTRPLVWPQGRGSWPTGEGPRAAVQTTRPPAAGRPLH